MKTAKEFIKNSKNVNYTSLKDEVKLYFIEQDLIEFAKMHVQKALQSAYDYHTIEKHKKEEMYDYPDIENFRANKKSIVNAYPLDLIK